LSNVRRGDSRHFRNKKREYLKYKITDIQLNRKNKNMRDLYRGITEFKKGYQPKTNLVKMRGAIILQILKKFGLVGRITSVSY
jgi:hypothetical protein